MEPVSQHVFSPTVAITFLALLLFNALETVILKSEFLCKIKHIISFSHVTHYFVLTLALLCFNMA